MNLLYAAVLAVGLLPVHRTVIIEDVIGSVQIAHMFEGPIEKCEEQHCKFIFRYNDGAILTSMYESWAEPGEVRGWPSISFNGDDVILYASEAVLINPAANNNLFTMKRFIRKIKTRNVYHTYHYQDFDPDRYDASVVMPLWERKGLTPVVPVIKNHKYWENQIIYPFDWTVH